MQQITLKNESILNQFNKVHGKNILGDCINFLEIDERDTFTKFLNGKNISHTIFITKVHLFEKYCKSLFPWLKKCYEYFKRLALTTPLPNLCHPKGINKKQGYMKYKCLQPL